MQTAEAPDLRFPVGKFQAPVETTTEIRKQWIATLAQAPAKYRAAVANLNDAQLDTPYRTGGWTIRQVIHHVPDSHMNAYVRFRLALTEDEPTIKPYAESLWAELADAKSSPVGVSLDLLDALHQRWVALLESLTPEQFQRKFRHPDNGLNNLEWTLGIYAWHCDHHLAHIESTIMRNGWR